MRQSIPLDDEITMQQAKAAVRDLRTMCLFSSTFDHLPPIARSYFKLAMSCLEQAYEFLLLSETNKEKPCT